MATRSDLTGSRADWLSAPLFRGGGSLARTVRTQRDDRCCGHVRPRRFGGSQPTSRSVKPRIQTSGRRDEALGSGTPAGLPC
jgi:hypothetical protein